MAGAQALETVMLLAFSVGWYVSIAKTIRVRVTTGKSAAFVLLSVAGYGCGIAAKLLDARSGAPLAPVTYLYAWNSALCALDLGLGLWFGRRRTGLV